VPERKPWFVNFPVKNFVGFSHRLGGFKAKYYRY